MLIKIKKRRMDYNKQIIDLIKERLEVGRKEYGHGIDINDGRDWQQESLEELLDACVYLSALILKVGDIGKDY